MGLCLSLSSAGQQSLLCSPLMRSYLHLTYYPVSSSTPQRLACHEHDLLLAAHRVGVRDMHVLGQAEGRGRDEAARHHL